MFWLVQFDFECHAKEEYASAPAYNVPPRSLHRQLRVSPIVTEPFTTVEVQIG